MGETSTFQIGASVAHAPEARSFFDNGNSVISADLRSTVLGLDIALKTLDPVSGTGLNIGAEFLRAKNESSDDGLTIVDTQADGFYAYIERIAGKSWSFGASGGRYEHAEDNAERSWDAGVFVTHRANEFNRIRLEARHFDDPGPNYYGVMLQWTVILGSHGHGVDW